MQLSTFYDVPLQLFDSLMVTNAAFFDVFMVKEASFLPFYVMIFFCVVMFGLINVNILYYSFSTLYQMCNLRQSL